MNEEQRRRIVLAVAISNVITGIGFLVLSGFGRSSVVLFTLGALVALGGVLAIGFSLLGKK
jgi:hypothetical protein